MRVVLDTNVLLSAFFTRGVCEALLERCINAGCTIILSDHILAEFTQHAEGKFRAPSAAVKAARDFLRRNAEFVDPVEVPLNACPDPDDLPVLGTAIAANADVLVTGDRDLLELKSVGDIPILTPRALLERLL